MILRGWGAVNTQDGRVLSSSAFRYVLLSLIVFHAVCFRDPDDNAKGDAIVVDQRPENKTTANKLCSMVENSSIIVRQSFIGHSGKQNVTISKCTDGNIVNSEEGLSVIFSLAHDSIAIPLREAASYIETYAHDSACWEKRLVDAGGENDSLVNKSYELGWTKLMMAVHMKDAKVARRLLERDADVEAVDDCGVNVLQHMLSNAEWPKELTWSVMDRILDRNISFRELSPEEQSLISRLQAEKAEILQAHKLMHLQNRLLKCVFVAVILAIIAPSCPLIDQTIFDRYQMKVGVWLWVYLSIAAVCAYAVFRVHSSSLALGPGPPELLGVNVVLAQLFTGFALGVIAHFVGTWLRNVLKDRLLEMEFHLVVVSASTKDAYQQEQLEKLESIVSTYPFASIGYDWKGSSSQAKNEAASEEQQKADEEAWQKVIDEYKNCNQSEGEVKIKNLRNMKKRICETAWYQRYLSLVRGACQGHAMKGKMVIMACVSGVSPIARVERCIMDERCEVIKNDITQHQKETTPLLKVRSFDTCDDVEAYLSKIRKYYRTSDVSATSTAFECLGPDMTWNEKEFELIV